MQIATTDARFEIAPCRKCSGQGTLVAYKHIANGVCFRCGGTGYDAAKYAEIVGRKANEFANAKAARDALDKIKAAQVEADIAAAEALIDGDFDGDFVEYLFSFSDAINEVTATA